MINLTLIKELHEEKLATGIDNEPLLQAITDLLHEVEKTPWRVRELVGTDHPLCGLHVKTPFLRLCYLMDRMGKLSMATVNLDKLMIELLLAEVTAFCIDWMKELEHARPEAD
jgi:hypothetical protein